MARTLWTVAVVATLSLACLAQTSAPTGRPDWFDGWARGQLSQVERDFLEAVQSQEAPAGEAKPIRFHVVDASTGKPVAGALLTVAGEASGFTDERGELVLGVVPNNERPGFGDRVPVSALCPGYLVVVEQPLDAAAEHYVALWPCQWLSVSGTVAGPDGKPVSGACVGVLRQVQPAAGGREAVWLCPADERDGPPPQPKTVSFDGRDYSVLYFTMMYRDGDGRGGTDAKGQFAFIASMCDTDPADPLKVVASLPNVGIAEQAVTAAACQRLNLKLAATGGITVGGTVFGADGQPVAGVSITDEHSRAKTTTDASGRFRLDYCQKGLFYFDFKMPGKAGKTPPSICQNSENYEWQPDWSNLRVAADLPAKPVPTVTGDSYSAAACKARGLAAMEAADFAAAIRDLSLSLLLGGDTQNWSNLALCHAAMGEPQTAAACVERGLLVDPVSGFHYDIRAWLAMLRDDPAGAAQDFAVAARLRPGDPYDAMGLYVAQLRIGKPQNDVLKDAKASAGGKWPAPLLRAMTGDLAADDCLKAAGSDKVRLAEARFWLAELSAARGEPQAGEMLQLAAATASPTVETVLARARLASAAATTQPARPAGPPASASASRPSIAPASRTVGVETVLLDFDAAGGEADWNAPQNAQVQWVDGPDAPPIPGARPAGKAMKIAADAKGGFVYTRRGKLPADLAQCEAITFWAYLDKQVEQPVVLELQLLEADGKAKFWRRVELNRKGWQKVVAPLRLMRWGTQRNPAWGNVTFLGIYFRDKAQVWVDNIAVVRTPGISATLGSDELAAIAFPGAPAQDVRRVEEGGMLILTDCRELDLPKLSQHLARAAAAVAADLGDAAKPATPPALVVFSQVRDYRAFAPRLAGCLEAAGAAPSSGGYTLQGVSSSSWDASMGSLRPVYLHEFVHSLLERSLMLPDNGDWLQEGLANYYQLRFHPQENIGKIVTDGLANDKNRTPLDKLCSGQRIELNRYWQAMTVARLLLEDPKYRDKLPAMLELFSKKGSHDLGPALKEVFGVTWDQFSADWREFCRKTYGK
jgi:tetratricopeptide (TPR) repeat protein